jgi:hypothetical protein
MGATDADARDAGDSGDAPENLTLLAGAKLAAFARIEAQFLSSFRFMEIFRGQQRMPTCTVADTVRYLHALWISECKDRLLSVHQTMGRYEGTRCLELLRSWQEGDTTSAVAFLQSKLNHFSAAELTKQIHEARAAGRDSWADRLTHGRSVVLNRSFHLLQALDAIFALPEQTQIEQVRAACAQLGHTPEQIDRQLAEMQSRLYAYVPHSSLARRNMLLMNELGIQVTSAFADRPGNRTTRVQAPTSPQPPYAEQAVPGEWTLISPYHTNARLIELVSYPMVTRQSVVAQRDQAQHLDG